MVFVIEIAIRLLGIYGLVLVGPAVLGQIDRMHESGAAKMALAITLALVLGMAIPALLWVFAPRLAQAATGGDQKTESISVNITLSDGLFLVIILMALVLLYDAATNLGQVLAWLAIAPFIREPAEIDVLVRLQYYSMLRTSLVMLVVRSCLGLVLLMRGRQIADIILARSARSS